MFLGISGQFQVRDNDTKLPKPHAATPLRLRVVNAMHFKEVTHTIRGTRSWPSSAGLCKRFWFRLNEGYYSRFHPESRFDSVRFGSFMGHTRRNPDFARSGSPLGIVPEQADMHSLMFSPQKERNICSRCVCNQCTWWCIGCFHPLRGRQLLQMRVYCVSPRFCARLRISEP